MAMRWLFRKRWQTRLIRLLVNIFVSLVVPWTYPYSDADSDTPTAPALTLDANNIRHNTLVEVDWQAVAMSKPMPADMKVSLVQTLPFGWNSCWSWSFVSTALCHVKHWWPTPTELAYPRPQNKGNSLEETFTNEIMDIHPITKNHDR